MKGRLQVPASALSQLIAFWPPCSCITTAMTKFNEWLTAGLIFLALWSLTYLGFILGPLDEFTKFHVLLSPVYLVILAGIVSASIVLYRTATFNDCPEAAAELKSQIKLAREDLVSKGFTFKSQ